MSPVRVAVVDATIGVHIPRVVRVAPMSRAQADVLRRSVILNRKCTNLRISLVLLHFLRHTGCTFPVFPYIVLASFLRID